MPITAQLGTEYGQNFALRQALKTCSKLQLTASSRQI